GGGGRHQQLFGDLTCSRIDPSSGRAVQPHPLGGRANLVDALAADEARSGLGPYQRAGRGIDSRDVSSKCSPNVEVTLVRERGDAPPADRVAADYGGSGGIDVIKMTRAGARTDDPDPACVDRQ